MIDYILTIEEAAHACNHHHHCLNLQTSRQRQLCSRSSSSSWMIADSLRVVEDVLVRTVRRLGPVAVAQQPPPLRGGWGCCYRCCSVRAGGLLLVWTGGLLLLSPPPSGGQQRVLSPDSPSLLLHVTSDISIITSIERLIIVRGNEVPKVRRWTWVSSSESSMQLTDNYVRSIILQVSMRVCIRLHDLSISIAVVRLGEETIHRVPHTAAQLPQELLHGASQVAEEVQRDHLEHEVWRLLDRQGRRELSKHSAAVRLATGVLADGARVPLSLSVVHRVHGEAM